MKKLIELSNQYLMFLTDIKPSKTWLFIRFLLHWMTFPLKTVGLFGFYLLIQVYILTIRTRKPKNLINENERRVWFKKTYYSLPIYDNTSYKLYVNRVKTTLSPNGINHNDDHQGQRHGVYAFLTSILETRDAKIDRALLEHIQSPNGAVRGYTLPENELPIYNAKETSGDQVIGLLLGALPHILNRTDDNILFLEKIERLVMDVINNDYALLDSEGKRKSTRAMWQPGLETVGAQAITLLAILKVGETLGNKDAKKHYDILNKKYGYSILSLTPTIFVPSIRGYFNDNNCITAAYILAKLSKGLERKLWITSMLYTWSLSYKWYNAYFTGLINDVCPGLISKSYISKCKDFLYEEEPLNYSRDGGKHEKAKEFPVSFNKMNQGEFHPDEDHKILIVDSHKKEHKSGLGWVAHAVMIDPEECKRFLKL